MRALVLPIAAAFSLSPAAAAEQEPKAPLLTAAETRALASEISGAAAKRTIEALSLHHRMRGSEGYAAAASLMVDRLKAYGLSGVEMIRLPTDGKIFYGTQCSRPAWNARSAELWEQTELGGLWTDSVRIASWADQPIILAQDSVSGRAEAALVDVGAGSSSADYAGKDVRGKLVLTSSQPEAVARLAVTERGAAGIVSWAQNQRTGWWGEDQSLIRWGHLSSWTDPTFAFMVSPAQAHAWQQRMAAGKTVRLRAAVEAGRASGAYLIPTAIIPGEDKAHEIVFSCHLDHPSPGANDNASGCSGILEIARTFTRLISQGRLKPPKRTIRFVWPAEIEGTIALLDARPELAKRALATIHLDMIGGNTDITKSRLLVEGAPPSLPSFVGDVGFAIARWVNAQASAYANTGAADFEMVEPGGTRNPLDARIGGFSEGSDHQVWAEGSWRVPVLYVADWPDRYIHTQKDVPANIDPTKLKRAMFIAAGAAWVLANLETESRELVQLLSAETQQRQADLTRRALTMSEVEAANLWRWSGSYEVDVARSLGRFGVTRPALRPEGRGTPTEPAFKTTYQRNPRLKGPMDGFGYSWLEDRLEQEGLPRPALLSRAPQWAGASYGYEALNLVDGIRSIQDIADDLSATVGAAPVTEVAEFLTTLERLGVIEPTQG
ncbi:DUF4910 domain-containing protein [Allosphingosinicella deserti]|uniref:Peptidase M28 domain-containing protein n=1 Tax=Allosphingosinicella deserti TaxID=2116704 RepID=A0A2P7QZ02_9SPHN|nr:DUF4910 domain-containing protein [Sphingomonas deserti]PSJ43179.1 hypothetical protein C7I55_01980 [Sphingomonas deserti]